MPILIPQDYHGELLREHRASTDVTEVSEEMPYFDDEAAPISTDTEQAETVSTERPLDSTDESHGTSLLGGLSDLLLGENSSEEETLLLLGIILLLLWGRLDRGGAFDRSTWGSDDLALLMIGYLLLS